MTKKYELTNETMEYNGHTLHRIKALVDIPYTKNGHRDFENAVKVGDLGGWVESRDNLSREGDCWIFDNAKVYGDAYVYGDAKVYDEVEIYDDAEVYGGDIYNNAEISGSAKVSGSTVCENAKINDSVEVSNSEIYGNAEISENAVITNFSEIYGDAKIYGKANINHCDIYDNAKIYGETKVEGSNIYDNAKIYGKAKIDGGGCYIEGRNIDIHGNVEIFDNAKIYNGNIYESLEITDNVKVYENASVNHGDTIIKDNVLIHGDSEIYNCDELTEDGITSENIIYESSRHCNGELEINGNMEFRNNHDVSFAFWGKYYEPMAKDLRLEYDENDLENSDLDLIERHVDEYICALDYYEDEIREGGIILSLDDSLANGENIMDTGFFKPGTVRKRGSIYMYTRESFLYRITDGGENIYLDAYSIKNLKDKILALGIFKTTEFLDFEKLELLKPYDFTETRNEKIEEIKEYSQNWVDYTPSDKGAISEYLELCRDYAIYKDYEPDYDNLDYEE